MMTWGLRGIAIAAILLGHTARGAEPLPTSSPDRPGDTRQYDKTDRYDVRPIEGWRALVNRALLESEPDLAAETLKVLGQHLFNVTRHLPAEAVAKLRQVTIWVELHEPHHACMAYHPDAGWLRQHDMNPDKAGCVEIAQARNFVKWTLEQPWMVFHELAHAYHHRFLPGGYENPEIAAAWRRAKEAKLYDAVLSKDAVLRRAYALKNPMEFFAENSESLFGTNDFYPFVRYELQKHDPATYELLKRLWGEK